jgi:hypothetical protein
MQSFEASPDVDQRVSVRLPWADFVRFLAVAAGRYVRRRKSAFLPGLDLAWLARFVAEPDNAKAAANLAAEYRRN